MNTRRLNYEIMKFSNAIGIAPSTVVADGTIYAWGLNTGGDVGDGTTYSQRTPVKVIRNFDPTSKIVRGESHTVAIAANGRLWAWGDNTVGQLGTGAVTAQSSPVSVSHSSSFVAIAGDNARHTLAIGGGDGRLWAWGTGTNGRLGNNSTDTQSYPVSVNDANSFIGIAVGQSHSAAIRGSDGTAWCWGGNGFGQIGDNSITDKSTPTSVVGGISFTSIASGGDHTVAIGGGTGYLWSWGLNSYGQLGNGTITNSSSPVSLSGSFGTASFIKVACGLSHTVAIMGSDGSAWAWGRNDQGQIGSTAATGGSFSIPASVAGNHSWKDVRCMGAGAIGLRWDNTVWYWGRAAANLLLSPQFPCFISTINFPIKISLKLPVAQLALGNYYVSPSTLIRLSTGQCYAMGFPNFGQLGFNDLNSAFTPRSVVGGYNWAYVATGGNHSAGIRASDGRLFAWGSNGFGQLGMGDIASSYSSPISVNDANSFVDVDCGNSHTVAIMGVDGSAWAWGYGAYGELGDGNRTSRSVPVSVLGGNSYKQIVCGDLFTLALRGNDGLCFGWGRNNGGQLANESATASFSSPVEIHGSISFVKIAAGLSHAAGIAGANGVIYCWGYNNYGQLGTNNRTSYSSPVSIVDGASYVDVACGGHFTVGIRGSDGSLWAWGINATKTIPNGLSGGLASAAPASFSSPVSAFGRRSYVKVYAGQSYAAAIDNNGSAWIWGLCHNENTIIANAVANYTPVQYPFFEDGASFCKAQANCGFLLDKQSILWGWGINTTGQLGLGLRGHMSFFQIVGGNDYLNVSWSVVASGGNHTIGIKLSDGTCWAWGRAAEGEIGDNQIASSRSSPVSVVGGYLFSDVACGSSTTCAIQASDGRLYGWGANTVGQIGDNTTTNQSSPVSVVDTASYIKIYGSDNTFMAIRGADGTAWGWGAGAAGCLGNNSISNASTPVSVLGNISFIQIARGASHNIGIKGSDGTAWAWGSDVYGELGQGNARANRSSPVSVAGNHSFIKLNAGASISAGLKADGSVWTWGLNTKGRLGVPTYNLGNYTTIYPNSISYPVKVAGGHSFIDILISNAMYGMKSDGTIWSWGQNDSVYCASGMVANLVNISPTQLGKIAQLRYST